jgi:hypothetical protein
MEGGRTVAEVAYLKVAGFKFSYSRAREFFRDKRCHNFAQTLDRIVDAYGMVGYPSRDRVV